MNRDDILRMAREQGLPETEVEGVFRVNSDDLGRMLAAERERIIAANAPEIERINAHIKELEKVIQAERSRACRIVTGLCISDNNAREINEAIRMQAADRLARHGIQLPDEDEEYGNPSF